MANPNIERLLREIAKEQEAEEVFLLDRIEQLEQLCRELFHAVWSEDTSTRTYETFKRRMEQLGLLEVVDE